MVGWVFPPIPRQEFIELRDRLVVDLVEQVCEPSLGIDIIELGSLNQRVHDGRSFSPTFGASEEPRLSSKRNHAFILPMSDKTSRSIIAGILCTGAVFHSNISSSGPVALLFT